MTSKGATLGIALSFLLHAAGALAAAQKAAQAPPPSQAGQAQAAASTLRPPWEARKTLDQLRDPLTKLAAALDQMRVENWQGVGASNYVPIAEGARRQVRDLLDALEVISKQPDRLSLVTRLFIALHQLEPPFDTLSRAASQFRDYTSARALDAALDAFSNQRDNLVKYLLELAEFDETSARLGQLELEACQEQLWQGSTKSAPARPKKQ
jgi:hypothetical protein